MTNSTIKYNFCCYPVLFFVILWLGLVCLPANSDPIITEIASINSNAEPADNIDPKPSAESETVPADSTEPDPIIETEILPTDNTESTPSVEADIAPTENTETVPIPASVNNNEVNTVENTPTKDNSTNKHANLESSIQDPVNDEIPNTDAASSLTEDQKAMSNQQLSDDPDLITPLVKPVEPPPQNKTTVTKLGDYPTPENTDYPIEDLLDDNSDDIGEFFEPEEIIFNNNSLVPEYVKVVFENKQLVYHPPKGKLFSFMRKHLLKRGQSAKPWTIENDFNGDGKPDWAALMVNSEGELDVVIVYSDNDQYIFEVLFEGAGKDNNSIKIALAEEKPGDKTGAPYKDTPGKYRTAKLEFPGIHVMYYTQSSSLYYWHNYYFDELLTSQ